MTTTEEGMAQDEAALATIVGSAEDEMLPVKATKEVLVRWLSGADLETDEWGDDDDDYDMALKILGAETLEKALEPDDVRKSETLVGTTFTVLAVKWRQSQKSKKPKRYAFLTCADDAGTKFYTSVGATKCVLTLGRCQRDNELPVTLHLAGIETGAGNTMLQFEIPSADF